MLATAAPPAKTMDAVFLATVANTIVPPQPVPESMA